MNLHEQLPFLDQSKRLRELGVIQKSLFAHCVNSESKQKRIACAAIHGDEYKDWSAESCQEVDFIAAFTVSEMSAVLAGHTPFWVAIWKEWGFKDCGGVARGYGSLASACAACLIDRIDNKRFSIEEVNKILSNGA